LKGLIAGRLSQLLVTKSGAVIGKGQVDLLNGRAIADFQARSLEGKSPAVALPGVLASTVVNNPAKLAGIGAGTIKGEIRDSAARPVPFALVQVHGLGMARTNAQGQYAFVNVPVGAYQVTVRQSGMKPKSSQVIVTVGASSTSQIQFAPADTLVSSHNSLLQA